MKPTVVKLGGSSAGSSALPIWLDALECAVQPLVLVPGGGPFADQVRQSQELLDYSDKAAHAMALLAMEQFGHVLLEKSARLIPARNEEEIGQAWGAGRIPLWFPFHMALAERNIPSSWNVTSDSLAAWLAGRIQASALLLIKQTDAFSTRDGLRAISDHGIVDPTFCDFLRPSIKFHVAGPRHASSAAELFARGDLPGELISTTSSVKMVG